MDGLKSPAFFCELPVYATSTGEFMLLLWSKSFCNWNEAEECNWILRRIEHKIVRLSAYCGWRAKHAIESDVQRETGGAQRSVPSLCNLEQAFIGAWSRRQSGLPQGPPASCQEERCDSEAEKYNKVSLACCSARRDTLATKKTR